jgi:hypothetical protein
MEPFNGSRTNGFVVGEKHRKKEKQIYNRGKQERNRLIEREIKIKDK